MNLIPYHARYVAMLLSRRETGVERFLPALSSATIDLHPHQVDTAVFTTRSPYRDGVILADEEGLGKTIEAGIVLLQHYLEGKTRLLVLCPASMVEFWKNELDSKFSLPLVGLNETAGGVVVLGYQKAYKRIAELADVAWDVCVMDEAHLLANSNLSEHIQANAIHQALQSRPKLLVTATPMQNSLLDLYYLVRYIDETTFPNDPEDFRARYMAKKAHRQELAERAQMLCQRTLRRQALTMPPIKRTVRTILVPPSPEEERLSRRLSLFFHRENLAAFPRVKEHQIRLTYWKMLASSPQALHESLTRLCERLKGLPEAEEELNEIQALASLARDIQEGARVRAFLTALNESLEAMRRSGAPERAVIFSENSTTLTFLKSFLSRHGYPNVVSYYGGNRAKRDITAFRRGSKHVLLTSDGGATGLDLSCCSLVVNYDLPWNVQKLEQRISRCHRYGQRHDVLVVNFLDPTNRADRRLYDSINKKLKHFDELFGASETILGQVANISDTTLETRDANEILKDNAVLVEAMRPEIERRVDRAETDLLAYFDDEVRSRFAAYGETIPAALSRINAWLWELTKYRLRDRAVFDEMRRSFVLDRSPYQDLRLRRITFGMERSLPPGERYHLGHPLARRILADCLEGDFDAGYLTLAARDSIVAGISGEFGLWNVGLVSEVTYVNEPLLCGVTADGKALSHSECADLLKLEVLDWQGGLKWDAGEGESYRGRTWRGVSPAEKRGGDHDGVLDGLHKQMVEATRQRLTLEHDQTLQRELDRLRQWAEDEETALKERQNELRRCIADVKTRSEKTSGYVQRFQTNQQAAELEKERRREEERLFLLVAEVRHKRDERIGEARRKSKVRFWDEEMFVVKFEVVDNAGIS